MALAAPNPWIFGITLASVVVFALATLAYVVFWPRVLAHNTALIAHVVEEGLTAYAGDHGQRPQGSDPQIVAALLGDNERKKSYLRPNFREFLDAQGRVLDSWKKPFRFEPAPDGNIKLRSAGPNGTFDDEDDLTSDALR